MFSRNKLFNHSFYHGSPFSFDVFKSSKAGIHFGTFDQAAHAATIKLARLPIKEFEALEETKGWKGKIYKCDLSLGKIKRISDPRTPQAWSRQIKKARDEGFSAIVYANAFEGSKAGDSYCIFEPTQVVSVERVI